jgi:hypothetical protein
MFLSHGWGLNEQNASEEEKTKKSCRDQNIMGGKRRRKKEFEDYILGFALIDFPRRTKKKDLIISLLSCCRAKWFTAQLHLLNSLCLPDITGCGGPLINHSRRNPINNVRKKDSVQMKTKERNP